MDLLEGIDYIKELKQTNPYNNAFRLIRMCDIKHGLLNDINNHIIPNTIYLQMKADYFPTSSDIIFKREMQFYGNMDNSIYALLKWGTELILLFHKDLQIYIELKQEYEQYLFSEEYVKALTVLSKLEQNVCCSVWGIQQKYLIMSLQEKHDQIKIQVVNLKDKCSKRSFLELMLFYYYRMVDNTIDFEEYNKQVGHLLESGDKKNYVWKYFQYKLDIVAPKTIHGMKSALIFDEQLSFIDYYETYIDVMQILSKREDLQPLLKECVNKIYRYCDDYRIRNLAILLLELENVDFYINPEECSIIEKYTCGKYAELEKVFDSYKNNNFMMYNLFIKAGIDISNKNIPHERLWKEIHNIYKFNYNENSVETINKYYKTFYCTSWKYKLLGIMIRKLNFNYEDCILKLSILNDLVLSPLFYQIMNNTTKQLSYLNQFKENAPATTQLHLYMLTDNIDTSLIDRILPMRFKYYEIKKYFTQKKYNECIENCRNILIELSAHTNLYYEERIRRSLYNCFLINNNYIDAIKLYVESYTITKKLVERMSLSELVPKIDDQLEGYDKLRNDICTPIIYRLFYKNADDEVISSYLDYLESRNCNTIRQLLSNYNELTKHEIIFLDKVCTQSLLMNDYVSKTEAAGSAAELRADVLRILLQYDKEGEKDYLAELNSLYKSIQLQKKIDSFNHNRIFIDKDNLLKYLKDELTQEFSKYKVVRELRNTLHDDKNEVISPSFLLDKYWDYHKFFYEIIDRIKREYLNESPYSLEDFLSARIRHNYCNDNLKKVFEEENLFSKKMKDNSIEYIVNEYWKNKLSDDEYNIVITKLSDFSKSIDDKIQEIIDKWIRIKKAPSNEGLFDYCNFTNYFFNYVQINFDELIENTEEFIRCVILELDEYTNKILTRIRIKIDEDLKPYYDNAICKLESEIKKLSFNSNTKNEMLRQIEISKARYIEDIDGFKDIFNMENEKYPDFTMRELIDFCIEIEKDMNNKFSVDKVNTVVHCSKKYSGEIFSYLVDIVAILIRNAVQHSEIDIMDELNIDIRIIPYKDSEIQYLLDEKGILQNGKEHFDDFSLVFEISNNLSTSVNQKSVYAKAGQIISNIYEHKFKEESSKEGGSGLYKIARTICYNLNTYAAFYLRPCKGFFNINIAINLAKFEKR